MKHLSGEHYPFGSSFGKWDLYSLSMVFTIPSSIKTGSGVAGGVRISSAPGKALPPGTAGRIHCALSGNVCPGDL